MKTFLLIAFDAATMMVLLFLILCAFGLGIRLGTLSQRDLMCHDLCKNEMDLPECECETQKSIKELIKPKSRG